MFSILFVNFAETFEIMNNKTYFSFTFLFLFAAAIAGGQSVDIYKAHESTPTSLVKRNMSKDLRIVKDSLIIQGDVEIGKISEWQTGDPNKKQFVIYLLNGKPIGDVFVKDFSKKRALVYSHDDGIETKIEFNPSLKKNDLKIYFVQYYIKNKYL